MEGMGLKLTPRGHLLRHSSMFGPMAGTSGTHSYSIVQTVLKGLFKSNAGLHTIAILQTL